VPSWLPDFGTIKSFISAFGWTKGVFTIFFFSAHAWIYRLYNGRLNDRQAEIERLAKDNHEYRERFLKLLDKHLGFNSKASSSKMGKPGAVKKDTPKK